ncbi:MAG: DNA polymerase IV [Eubacteriales bacterium]|nr:DNA polymerase IV [Eubacteriales bacterium]
MRVILHADLNNFYASVACRQEPRLMERPVAVCGDPSLRHGIVLAKNTPAKKLGVQTGQVIWQARQTCPELLTVGVDYREVLRMSAVVRGIFQRYTSHVQPFGSDEAWLDISGPRMDIQDGVRIANHLRHTVREETGLTVSVGVSNNRIFSKLGSDLKKPDAVSVVCEANRDTVLDPLPISDLLFIGRKTAVKLNNIGIYTIGQLHDANPAVLKSVLGKTGLMLSGFAHGDDAAGVLSSDATPQPKSIGNSVTTSKDLHTLEEAKITLFGLCESVGMRLRRHGLMGRVVQLTLRDTELKTFQRQRALSFSTDCSFDLFETAYSLLRENWTQQMPLRLLGVNASQLCPVGEALQLSFLPEDNLRQKRVMMERTVDEIREKYGYFAIRRAVMLSDSGLGNVNPAQEHVLVPEPYFRKE